MKCNFWEFENVGCAYVVLKCVYAFVLARSTFLKLNLISYTFNGKLKWSNNPYAISSSVVAIILLLFCWSITLLSWWEESGASQGDAPSIIAAVRQIRWAVTMLLEKEITDTLPGPIRTSAGFLHVKYFHSISCSLNYWSFGPFKCLV